MRDDDPQAGNLFSRLVSYVPSHGGAGQSRIPLEDYCTEALAWCLRSSPQFSQAFFAIANEKIAAQQLQISVTPAHGIEVHTQFSLDGGSRRFDLAIHSPVDAKQSFFIVVENKVKRQPDFTPDQIGSYQKLLTGEQFKKFRPNLLVIFLAPSEMLPDKVDNGIPVIPMSWSAVHQALVSGVCQVRSRNQLDLPAAQFVCAQFANFLNENELALMNIPKASPGHIEGIELREQLAGMLKHLAEGAKQEFRRDVQFEKEANGRSWLGLHGSVPEEQLYVGFQLRDKKGNPAFCMLIERTFPNINSAVDSELKRKLSELDCQRNLEVPNGWRLIQPILGDQHFDGNAQGVVDWFALRLAALQEIIDWFAAKVNALPRV